MWVLFLQGVAAGEPNLDLTVLVCYVQTNQDKPKPPNRGDFFERLSTNGLLTLNKRGNLVS